MLFVEYCKQATTARQRLLPHIKQSIQLQFTNLVFFQGEIRNAKDGRQLPGSIITIEGFVALLST